LLNGQEAIGMKYKMSNLNQLEKAILLLDCQSYTHKCDEQKL